MKYEHTETLAEEELQYCKLLRHCLKIDELEKRKETDN